MNHSALQALRAKLAADVPVYGLWITLEAPSITEMAVGLGLDWVVIDAEHGHLDWSQLVAHVRCVVRSGTICLIRIATLDRGLIKRALDIGADGVVIPWIESAQQLRSARHAASYPPLGRRGIGAERATAWTRAIAEHVAQAQDILVIPIIESVEGGKQAAEMATVPGIEVFFIGPADWSATAGYAGQWAGPEVAAQISTACAVLRGAGKQIGILATSEEDLRLRRREGFRMLGLGIDGALLLRALDGMLPATGSLRALRADLVPHRLGTAAAPLREAVPALRPEQAPRVVSAVGAPQLELDDRALVTTLVGRHCAARQLIAALVRFAPAGGLVWHCHPQPETVVVIRGAIITEMDGVRHQVEAGSSVTIPAGTAHRTGNASLQAEALIQVAMPCDAITRTVLPVPEGAALPLRLVPPPMVVAAREPAEAQALTTLIEHAGARDPSAGLRCRTLVVAAGQMLIARLQAVDSALVVLQGVLRVRTPSQVFTLRAEEALQLPRGTAAQLQAHGTEPVTLIETCADSQPLDALVDPAMLTPWPAAAAASHVS